MRKGCVFHIRTVHTDDQPVHHCIQAIISELLVNVRLQNQRILLSILRGRECPDQTTRMNRLGLTPYE